MKTSEVLYLLAKGSIVGLGVGLALEGGMSLAINTARQSAPEELQCSVYGDFIRSLTTFVVGSAVSGVAATVKFVVDKTYRKPSSDSLLNDDQNNNYGSNI